MTDNPRTPTERSLQKFYEEMWKVDMLKKGKKEKKNVGGGGKEMT